MLRFQFSPCHTLKKKWKTHICWEFSAWHEFISKRVKIIFFEQIKLVNIYKTIVYYTMEYPALKTFATLPSTFTLNILSLVSQPNRNLLTLNDIQWSAKIIAVRLLNFLLTRSVRYWDFLMLLYYTGTVLYKYTNH